VARINILVPQKILQLLDHVPGGCSSGSGVALAGGMVDFALAELIFVCFLFKQDVSLLTLLINVVASFKQDASSLTLLINCWLLHYPLTVDLSIKSIRNQ
jgi:hypothetical protein